MQPLAAALPHVPALEELALEGNHLDVRALALLVPALQAMPRLARLRLDGCRLGATGIKALGEALPRCTELVALSVARNELGSEGGLALARVLPRLSELQSLSAGHNDFEPAAVAAVAAALTACDQLHTLDLSGSAAPEHVLAAVPGYESLTTLRLTHLPQSMADLRPLVAAVMKSATLEHFDVDAAFRASQLDDLRRYAQLRARARRHMRQGMLALILAARRHPVRAKRRHLPPEIWNLVLDHAATAPVPN